MSTRRGSASDVPSTNVGVLPRTPTEVPSTGWLSVRGSPLAALLCAACATGCAGGGPLLHPAKTLPTGDVRAAAGFSANVATGHAADALRSARDEAAEDPNAPGP